MAKFEIFRGKGRLWFFRLKADNNRIVLQSEGYSRKRNALKGINSIIKCAKRANIEFVEN